MASLRANPVVTLDNETVLSAKSNRNDQWSNTYLKKKMCFRKSKRFDQDMAVWTDLCMLYLPM